MTCGGKSQALYLRVSTTEGCALRCPYCQPDGPQVATGRSRQLTPAEIARVVRGLERLGVNRVRLTGGEPLSRPDCLEIVERLRRIDGIREISLTTNGERLAKQASDLKRAGLDRINIHLDSLRPDRFRELARRDSHAAVLAGIEAAQTSGLTPIKLNTVMMKGINDDELVDFCQLAVDSGFVVRFIELMDTGPARDFVVRHFMSGKEAREIIGRRFDVSLRFEDRGASPAQEYLLDGGRGTIGFIASESVPFCDACNRLRLTSDGRLQGCLYEAGGTELRWMLRDEAVSEDDLMGVMASTLARKQPYHPQLTHLPRQRFSMAQVGG